MHATGASALILAGICVLATPILLYGWLWIGERVVHVVPRRYRHHVRVAIWLGPAFSMLGIYLIWPTIYTVVLSLRNANSTRWVGVANFRYLADSPDVRSALRNNALWLVILVAGCTTIGLLLALLSNHVRYEALAKSVVIAPLAISFVSGAVIWRSMYDYEPPGFAQTGTVNAVLTSITHSQPVAWLVDGRTNNLALITVGVWMTAGFATVILSAALKGLPPELSEAARVDGATGWQELRHITLPQLRPTLLVVAVMLAIAALKAFDVVYVMTNGGFNTNVIANVLYHELFVSQDYGRASAIALLLVALASPIIVFNARSQRARGAEG